MLFLGLEDGLRRLKRRMETILQGDAAPEDLYFPEHGWPPFTGSQKGPNGLDYLHTWLELHKDRAKLVVVDTLARVRGQSHSNDQGYLKDYKDLEEIQTLANLYDVAILVVHHTNKQRELKDVFHAISGTTGLAGASDNLWLLQRSDRTKSEATLHVSGRDIETLKGAVNFDGATGLWSWLGEAGEVSMGKERIEIVSALRAANRPLKAKDIAAATGKRYHTVYRLLGKMLEAGEVEKSAQSGAYVLPVETIDTGPTQGEIHLDRL